MAKFCTNCGKEISDGIAFCTECGTPAPAEKPKSQDEKTPEAPPPQQTYQLQPQQTYQQPVYAPPAVMQDAKPKGGRHGVVGTGAFFGLMLLFSIPVIGWIACIIMAFAPKNENIKHYAKAMLIWIIIGIVLSVAAYFVFQWLSGSLIDYINQVTDGAFGDWKDIFGQFEQFKNGDFSCLPDMSSIPME